ncbi:hypothetical protein ACLOJK_029518, partial [Asimina triloba]
MRSREIWATSSVSSPSQETHHGSLIIFPLSKNPLAVAIDSNPNLIEHPIPAVQAVCNGGKKIILQSLHRLAAQICNRDDDRSSQ